MNWHTLPVEEVLKQTDGSIQGLSTELAKKKLQEHGKNELQSKTKTSPLKLFLRQFADVMIVVLLAAALISFFIGEAADTIVIVFIVVLNAVIGFIQEYRAGKAMEALQQMAAPSSKVLRNGSTTEIPSSELVPGDIVLLEAGNMIPADMRLLEAESIKINEASLTGESNTVDKQTEPLSEKELPLGDRSNITFKGTLLTNGRGKGIVVATGMQTELGKIAGMLDSAQSETPLQLRLNRFSKKLTFIVIGLCAALFFVGYLRGEPFNRMLLTAISLAVAAIPEALPAVITVSLALGARRLAKQEALIRKLYAVETLGSVTYICTDKTGTLTRNEMKVEKVWHTPESSEALLLQAMSLNHDVMEKDGKPSGEATELALVAYAGEQEQLERVKEIPFDSNRKAMTTIHKIPTGYLVITKGASEYLASISNHTAQQEIKTQEEAFASEGMRVIAYATKELKELPAEITPENIEKELNFTGIAGLMDPPREEAKQAIRECKQAGIVPVMITGDHPLTAAAIARELGIVETEADKIVTGRELEQYSEEKVKEEVEQIKVYARVSPEQKFNIVTALQENNQFVSMTGDGVNDAPALKQANIGVAMGITGTDVTKEAAHMILLNDNFATIVKAVKEGRRIYDNIRKFIKYILTGNTAEIWSIFLAPLLGLPIPLLPVHILWVNLVTDGLPAIALAAEAPEKHIMDRPPRDPDENIFAQGLGVHVLWVGIFIGLITIGAQWYALEHQLHWQTIAFSVLCFCQLWHVMAIRSETRSVFKLGLMGNIPLLLSVAGTLLLQLGVIYIPFLNTFFHTEPLTLNELLFTLGVSGLVMVAVEMEKVVRRR
ncbi:cation-translocating P-type ATPase [Parasegetibacter sp. NRK P23]|uniref:cation-translocating P-type ATPase n=1 Tax=Parasegetibacter sp. NRK P23 TaxID=2942999 RepID=UPI002043F721|nr:cation-translocating P-type ATPase [Parasegetibacter sp. NRK P23]MCM5527334.1 cation-translocating P-type ATPase [Parasegetibacter sp. NRK P23]